MHYRSPLFAIAAASLLAACATDSTGTSTDYATDSWANPTMHGELSFEERNTAELTESARFHGWYFTLSADAEVDLQTAPKAQNLDTVMYLYNADADGKKYGEYIAKNDDASSSTMASKLTEALPAGTYFVQVKAAHQLMTGRFDLETDCSGAGCPFSEVPSVQDYCDSTEEGIGKCVDDSLDATEEGCAPGGYSADAVLCCNQTDEWYCDYVCGDSLQIPEVWGESLSRVEDAFPDTEWHYLTHARLHAVATCASPTLADIESVILAQDELLELESGDGPWEVDGWVDAGDPNFVEGDASQEIIDAVSGIAGEPVSARWSASADIPCPNCTDGVTKQAYFFATSGKLILIESRWGGDS
ncbi:MAG: DVUA0089 family protein [Deltaproteobacteria bacterium]|jgi:hypothetical protein|nr:DVUA0089 family protein [Deltaproteobacteria bacterium]MBW2532201.1 DVUA0089 family protein [Deltaproteobacteria bacterium]